MKKFFLLYSLSVSAVVILINEFWPLQLYGSDGYYFWGLAKFIVDGKLENTNIFWHLYPSGFSFMLAFLISLIPKLSYEQVGLGLLITYLILGPLIFIKIYNKETKNSLIKGLFFFYFAVSGFYIVEYLIGEIILPQALAFLLLPLYPYLLFSHKNKIYIVLLIFALYLLHSPTLLFILVSTALCAINKKTRKQTLWAAALLAPFILLKILHLVMLGLAWPYAELPFNSFLSEYNLSTSPKIFTETYVKLPMYQVLLSGVPIFIWILFSKNKRPEFVWYRSLALISTFAIIFYQSWSEILPFSWPRERYLGFLWLPIGLSFPYIFSQKIKFKVPMVAFTSMFIIFQFGMAFYRETRVNEHIEAQTEWLMSFKSYDAKNVVVLYKGNGGTYAYGIFPPANIYQVFPTKESKTSMVNTRSELPGYYKDILPQNIEDNLINAEIDLIIIDKNFIEILKSLESSSRYKFASSFNDEAYAYILAE